MPLTPPYATPTDFWRFAAPPDTLFKDKGLEAGVFTQAVKTVSVGTGTMSVDLDSNPRDTFAVIVECVTGGEVNVLGEINLVPPPQFKISLNGGLTYSLPMYTNANQQLEYKLGGFSVTFANVTVPSFVAGDRWTFSTSPSPDVLSALDASTAYVNSYLGQRCKLPLLQWGDDIRLLCSDIARWFLIKRRGLDVGQDYEVYEPKMSMDWLTAVAKGQLTPMVIESPGSAPTSSSSYVYPSMMVSSAPYKVDWRG